MSTMTCTRTIGLEVELDVDPRQMATIGEWAARSGPFALTDVTGSTARFEIKRPDIVVGSANLVELHRRLAQHADVTRLVRLNG
jgi:hypothetical protein